LELGRITGISAGKQEKRPDNLDIGRKTGIMAGKSTKRPNNQESSRITEKIKKLILSHI